MKTRTQLAVLAVLLAAGPLWAGPLKPVACEPGEALSSRPFYITGGSNFRLASGQSGLMNSQALIAGTSGKGWKLEVAIDSSKPDAKAPDVVRVNFSGKDDFTGAAVTPLKPVKSPATYFIANFGPVVAKAVVNGQTVPVTVSGQYFKSKSFRRFQLTFGTAVQGTCRFGDKELPVRIIDGNNDLQAGSAWQKRSFGKNVAVVPGDTVAVDLGGDGKFDKDVRKACYGSPVAVGGKWYNVTASADGKQIAATPVSLAGGMLHIDHPKWSLMLMGDKFVLPIEGGSDPVAVPAGKYAIRSFDEFSAPDAQDRRAHLGVSISPAAATSAVTIEPGKTTDLAIGSPIRATVRASNRGGQIVFSLDLKDAAGRPINALTQLQRLHAAQADHRRQGRRRNTGLHELAGVWLRLHLFALVASTQTLSGMLTVSLKYDTSPFKIVVTDSTFNAK